MAYCTNRAAHQRYEITDTVQAGVSLLGTEVKSIRSGSASLRGSTVLIRGGEAFLVGASIPPYQKKNVLSDYNPERPRRLLLSKKELRRLYAKTESGNLTLVPMSIYNRGRVLKVEIGIGRKKQAQDKRESIKKREQERSIRRRLKH